MGYAIPRLKRYHSEGDLSHEKTVERITREIAETELMHKDKASSIYLAISAYTVVGLGTAYLATHRTELTPDHDARLQAACDKINPMIAAGLHRPETKPDHWALSRLYAEPLLDLMRLFADVLDHPPLSRCLYLWEAALIDTAAWYFQADPDLHPVVLFSLCTDIDAIIQDGNTLEIFQCIGTLHSCVDFLCNDNYRTKRDQPRAMKDKRGNRRDRLIKRRAKAAAGGPDHELLEFFDIAINEAETLGVASDMIH